MLTKQSGNLVKLYIYEPPRENYTGRGFKPCKCGRVRCWTRNCLLNFVNSFTPLSLSLSTLVVWCVMSCHAMPCGVSCHVVSWNGRATGHHHILASEECCWLNRRPLGRERKTDIGHIDEPGFETLYFYVDRATWSFNIPSFNHRYMGFWFKVSSEINLVRSP